MALMQCPECGKEVSDKAAACPHCGCPIPSEVPPEKTSAPVPEVKPVPVKKRRGCLTPVLVVLAILFVLCLLIYQDEMKKSPSEPGRSNSILAKELGLTEEQEAAMVDIFTQCGIGEITSASEFQGGEGHTSYHLDDEETAQYAGTANTIVVWVTDETKAVESIYFHDQDIYVDGTVLGKVTDYYVNSEDRNLYRLKSQTLVNQLLNYPDTAKYPAISGWRFGVQDGDTVVQSSVNSKNAFGMESSLDFQVKFRQGNPVSLILNGKEYIK